MNEAAIAAMIKSGIAVTSAALTVSSYAVFRTPEMPSVGELTQSAADYTAGKASEAKRFVEEWNEIHAELIDAEEAARLAEQQLADYLANHPTKNEDGSPLIYEEGPDGQLHPINLPNTLHYIDNDYNLILDTAMGPMLYFNQGDSHWTGYMIGGRDRLGRYGCGPTVVSMIVNSFNSMDNGVSPVTIAEWALANNQYAMGGGSYHSLIPNALTAYGMQVAPVTERTPERVHAALDQGHLLVALMGKGDLTNNGHFIIIAQHNPDGSVMIADSNRFDNCTKAWDLNSLLSQMKGPDKDGGPLWEVWKQ
ncbi:MAG: C39 family peptidase [Bacillota bacterium]|uniref:Peptidase_C39 like family protein n=1 Tax=[Clostridium] aminophilum TaxID=1526 RepID=A0A1I6IWE5_9FIRM|nr:C39 family peptidase [[Clostridium] aminophilum]MDT3844610.1 C39 family peptidase [Bacillota bacterium]SFR70550.1 Peptidase_C39 like family protein [[Clostridium] aminophilum]